MYVVTTVYMAYAYTYLYLVGLSPTTILTIFHLKYTWNMKCQSGGEPMCDICSMVISLVIFCREAYIRK